MFHLTDNVCLKNASLIFPSVSVGNVGQFSADLIIKTLKLKRIGYVDHSSIIPLVGNNAYSLKNEICLSCELYWSEETNIVVLQIRSGFAGDKKDFVTKFCNWLKEVEIKQIIVLTGSYAHERKDKQLIGEPLRYIFCPLTCEKETPGASARGWIQHEQVSADVTTKMIEKSDWNISVPGSGLSIPLLRQCINLNIPCTVLIEFCLDGNNIPDAVKLCNYLDSWINLRNNVNVDDWSFPLSWRLLFGPSEIPQMYN